MSSPAPAHRRRPIVVGISGASCSGKTWLADAIRSQKPDESEIVDLDGYYRDLPSVQLLDHGHDNPASIDFDRVLDDLRRLKNGEPASLPVYCYEQHRIKGYRDCQPRPFILFEGLFAFADDRVRAEIDIKIWLDADADERFTRRIDRDTARRERTPDEIRERYERDVVPGYRKFISPLREHADLIIGNDSRDASRGPSIISFVLSHLDSHTKT